MTIKQRQCLLYYLGYYVGEIDGKWGTLSKTATKAFQKDFGLTADGIVGESTEKALAHAVCYGMPAKEEPESGDFWDEIKYFKKSEFKCRCGGKYCNGYPAEPQEKLIRLLDKVREHFGKPITVSSGVRCKQHNANVGGVSNSRHLTFRAVDFCVSGLPSSLVLPYVQSLPGVRYAYAIDGSFIHMDIE